MRFVKWAKSGLKGGLEVTLGKLTAIIGENGSGKTAVVDTVTLCVDSSVTEVQGRKYARATSLVKEMVAKDASELRCEIELNDGERGEYSLVFRDDGTMPKIPTSRFGEVLSVKALRQMFSKKAEGARAFLVGKICQGITIAQVVEMIPKDLQNTFTERMKVAVPEEETDPLKIVGIVETHAREDKNGKASRRNGLNTVLEVGEQDLPEKPTPEAMEASRAARDKIEENQKTSAKFDGMRQAKARKLRLMGEIVEKEAELSTAETNLNTAEDAPTPGGNSAEIVKLKTEIEETNKRGMDIDGVDLPELEEKIKSQEEIARKEFSAKVVTELTEAKGNLKEQQGILDELGSDGGLLQSLQFAKQLVESQNELVLGNDCMACGAAKEVDWESERLESIEKQIADLTESNTERREVLEMITESNTEIADLEKKLTQPVIDTVPAVAERDAKKAELQTLLGHVADLTKKIDSLSTTPDNPVPGLRARVETIKDELAELKSNVKTLAFEGGEVDPFEGKDLAADLKVAKEAHEVLVNLCGQWETLENAKREAIELDEEIEKLEALLKACSGLVGELLEGNVKKFEETVEMYLFPGERFNLILKDGEKDVCRYALLRGKGPHTALSGAEDSRVVMAIALALAFIDEEICGEKDQVRLILLDDCFYHTKTIQALVDTLAELGDLPAQVIIQAAIDPGDVTFPAAWTVIERAA